MLFMVNEDDNYNGRRFSGFRGGCWLKHLLVDFDTGFTKEHAASIFCVTELGYTGRNNAGNSVTLTMEAACSSETSVLTHNLTLYQN